MCYRLAIGNEYSDLLAKSNIDSSQGKSMYRYDIIVLPLQKYKKDGLL